MSLQPKITIIIPVYNVERYLRQCLDSVLNQTIQDIQIICVNDGSLDGSHAILQEYADRDSRIEIIDKPNGGLSSARNAAYPSIKGKYTMFVDSDDWIDLETCAKTYQKAKETGASIVVFFYEDEEGNGKKQERWCMYSKVTSDDKSTVEEKIPLFGYPCAWGKLWCSEFLLKNQLYFPEGLIFEDNPVNWKGITHANRISIVPEKFYHYRRHQNSITGGRTNERYIDLVQIYCLIHDDLMASGNYEAYKDIFHQRKLNDLYNRHQQQPCQTTRYRFRVEIRRYFTKEDKTLLCESQNLLSEECRHFYLSRGFGGSIGVQIYQSELLSKTLQVQHELLRLQKENKPLLEMQNKSNVTIENTEKELQEIKNSIARIHDQERNREIKRCNRKAKQYRILQILTLGTIRSFSRHKSHYRNKIEQLSRHPIVPKRPKLRQKLKSINRKIMRPLEKFLKKTNRTTMRPLERFLKKTNRTVMRPAENFIRYLRGKPMKRTHPVSSESVQSLPTIPAVVNLVPVPNADQRIYELCEQVCQLSKEVVELRELQNRACSASAGKRVA